MGGIGLAVAGEARVQQGYARTVFAREARVEQAAVGTHRRGARDRRADDGRRRSSSPAGRGAVRPLLDWRGALAFGAALGLVVGLLRRR